MKRQLLVVPILALATPLLLLGQNVASANQHQLQQNDAVSVAGVLSDRAALPSSPRRAFPTPLPASDLRPLAAPLWALDPAASASEDLVSIAQREGDLMALEPQVDAASAAERLAVALQIPTISWDAAEEADSVAFRSLHSFLDDAFPLLHRRLSKEVVSGLSLLYTWKGRRPDLEAILLMAHMDVVPPEYDGSWSVDPMGGINRDGYIWGRGAIDNKQGVLAMLEAVERLVREGFEPERTLYLAFGHDEEIGGGNGARRIAHLLQERRVRLSVVLDEGGVIVNDFLPGAKRPIAGIGIAEKGSVSLKLSVNVPGGHSAAPSGSSAIGRLGRAVHRVESNPFPARLNGVTRETLRGLSKTRPRLQRMMMANASLFRPLVVAAMSRNPQANAMIRTTIAPTVISAGEKANVLPSSASAVINFRMMPGETTESVLYYVRMSISDPGITIRAVGTPREASVVSKTDTHAYRALSSVIEAITPGEDVLVVPFLVPGGTDSRHFSGIAEAVYRFTPMMLDKEDLSRFHGADERIPVLEYVRMIKGYHLLIQRLQEL